MFFKQRCEQKLSNEILKSFGQILDQSLNLGKNKDNPENNQYLPQDEFNEQNEESNQNNPQKPTLGENK